MFVITKQIETNPAYLLLCYSGKRNLIVLKMRWV